MVFRYSFPLSLFYKLLSLCEHSLYSSEWPCRTLLPYSQPSGYYKYFHGNGYFFFKEGSSASRVLSITLLVITWVEGFIEILCCLEQTF